VQPDRLSDLRAEPLGQPDGALLAVPVVSAAHEVPAGDRASEVPDVVQQRRGDQRRPRPGLLGQRGRLQHVLGLSDRLAQVVGSALAGEQVLENCHWIVCRHRCSPPRPRVPWGSPPACLGADRGASASQRV
jgi:hypothetical protein